MNPQTNATPSSVQYLDAITTMHPTAEQLRTRAAFWRRWVEGEPLSAGRNQVLANAALMMAEADRMQTAAPIVRLVSRESAAPSKRAPVKTTRPNAEQFWTMHAHAVSEITKWYGARWHLAPDTETVLVSVPPRLRSYIGPLGGRITWRRDWRMPAARYWPDGCLPAGIEAHDPGPRYTGLMDPGAAWRAQTILESVELSQRLRQRQADDDQAAGWCKPGYPHMQTARFREYIS